MQTIALYGGSFNPIHLGHLEKMKRLCQLSHFDQVYFLPCGQHALKDEIQVSHQHRLEMLKLALHGFDFKIDDQEIMRPGKTWTIDTLRNYRKNYGEEISLSFVMGHDAFCHFMHWKEYEHILGLAHIILLSRPDSNCRLDTNHAQYLKRHLATHLNLIQTTSKGFIFDIQEKNYSYSSTDIRNAILAQTKPLGLDPKVYAYIQKHQLYLS